MGDNVSRSSLGVSMEKAGYNDTIEADFVKSSRSISYLNRKDEDPRVEGPWCNG